MAQAARAVATNEVQVIHHAADVTKRSDVEGFVAVIPWLTLSAPGVRIRTKFEALAPETRGRILGLSPMKRPAEAEEVAATIAFLASEEAA